MATAEGTRRFLARATERGALHLANVRTLGPSRLSCAAVGFGAYRVGGDAKNLDTHLSAVRSAVRAGVNLLDTSAHYSAASKERKGGGHGDSERLIGKAIADAIADGDAARDELIVCTKVGHVARGATPPPSSVSISPQGGSDDWHSIHPSFLEAEVRSSAERLGTAPDFVLLHNPEYFLSSQMLQKVNIADAWDEMYDRLRLAFSTLERLCDEGLIGNGYGVSGNFLSCSFSTTGRANLYEALAVDRVVDAAVAAAGGTDAHHLRLVQLPINLLEGGAVLGRKKAVAEASEGDCTVASRLGLGVVGNRPLHGIPLPGLASGDWGRQGASHIRFRDVKPMGTVEALLKRVLNEALSLDGHIPMQQAALRLSLSAPSLSCCLCGARRESYVEDVAAALQAEPFTTEQVSQTLLSMRSAATELGGESRRFW